MSLGLTKPGASAALRHPKTGALLEPVGYLKNGKAVWPVLGAAPDDEDPDDPTFTGEDDAGDDDEEDEDDDKKSSKKSSKSKKSDDDEDDDDEEGPKSRPERQAARYRVRLREAEKREADLAARLKAIEDKDKPKDEVVSRDLTEARQRAEKLASTNRSLVVELAFLRSNTIDWADAADALALAKAEGLLDDAIDEDGTVDSRALRASLRDLAKRKPHLVKKAVVRDDADDDEDDEEPRSTRSGSALNGRRKGSSKAGKSREELAKSFPVLRTVMPSR